MENDQQKNQQTQQYLGDLDISDEMRIQFSLDEFYNSIIGFEGLPDQITKMKLRRNNLVNVMATYLKKFNNPDLMKEFYTNLKNAKEQATKKGRINKYQQYMNEIRVVQDYLKIRENLAEKVAHTIVINCLKVGEDLKETKEETGDALGL